MNNYVELKIYILCVEQKNWFNSGSGLTYLVFVETIHCVNGLWVHRPPEEIEVHRTLKVLSMQIMNRGKQTQNKARKANKHTLLYPLVS